MEGSQCQPGHLITFGPFKTNKPNTNVLMG